MIKDNCRVQIRFQHAEDTELAVVVNASEAVESKTVRIAIDEFQKDGCSIGSVTAAVKNTDPLAAPVHFAKDEPVRIYIPTDRRPAKITALYMFSPWWTRPAFVRSFQDIPEKTQVALFKYEDGFGCLVPAVGTQFKTTLAGGTETELCLVMDAGVGGFVEICEPLFVYAEADTVRAAVHRAFAWLIREKHILPREKRRVPDMFRYLGWCSWNAFYTDVTAAGLKEKAAEFEMKQLPVRWMLIDDGWFPSADKKICDFRPDAAKFPDGFRQMIHEIRQHTDISWVGVWHALAGYWGGVAPGSCLAKDQAAHLYESISGQLVPDPKHGAGFYRDWCEVLEAEGIDFIKVDGQSAVPFYFDNSVPVSAAARGMNEALESGAYRMDGAIINCMGMAMENVLARPRSAISRNSDDFFPDQVESFAEHLLQNAYNAIYHDEIYCCDWDMFWTRHKYAAKHALLRAVSGGPVYFSDKVGETDPEVLKPLMCADGSLLMMDRSAKPTEDCIFKDPLKEGLLKLHNTGTWGGRHGGGIAVYNLTGKPQVLTFVPNDIPELDQAEEYVVYDYFADRAFVLGAGDTYTEEVEKDGYRWYVLLPKKADTVCFGLTDKYTGFTAVKSIIENGDAQLLILRASGSAGWYSDKAPEKVLVNGFDMTDRVTCEHGLYKIQMPESMEKMVLMIC